MAQMVVAVGSTDPQKMVYALDSVRRPFRVVTMDELWFEAAAELGFPRYFFKDKLQLMLFVRSHEIICVYASDKTKETTSMIASMYAMGAAELPVGNC